MDKLVVDPSISDFKLVKLVMIKWKEWCLAVILGTLCRRDLIDKLGVHPSDPFQIWKWSNLFFKCNLCWMGGRLSIHVVVYPSNVFYLLLLDLWMGGRIYISFWLDFILIHQLNKNYILQLTQSYGELKLKFVRIGHPMWFSACLNYSGIVILLIVINISWNMYICINKLNILLK